MGRIARLLPKIPKNRVSVLSTTLYGIGRKEKSLAEQVREILTRYSGTMLIPGPDGMRVESFQPGNYRESTGQTLASVDQQIGLVVDAAQSLGPELLPTLNFNSWLPINGATAVSDTSFNTTIGGGMRLPGLLTPGKMYAVTVTFTISSGTLSLFADSSKSELASGVTVRIVSDGTGFLYLKNSGAANTVVSGISVRELPGIHAQQATSGYQSYLRRVPKTLGPELVSNGTFDSADGWSMGTGWNISGGALNHTAPSTLTSVLTTATQAGKTYQCVYSVTAQSAAGSGVSLRLGNTNLAIRNALGTYSETVVQTADSTSVGFIARGGSGDWLGSIDNVSVREVLDWTYAWQFDGTDDRFALSSVLSGSSDFCDLHAVTLQPKASASTFADCRNSAGTGTHVGRLRLSNTGILVVAHMNDAGTTVGANGPNIGNAPVVVGSVRQGNSHTVLVDNTAVLSTTLSGVYTCTHSTLGARGSGTSENMQGYIHGSILLPSNPTEEERTILTKFLATLQGRSL